MHGERKKGDRLDNDVRKDWLKKKVRVGDMADRMELVFRGDAMDLADRVEPMVRGCASDTVARVEGTGMLEMEDEVEQGQRG